MERDEVITWIWTLWFFSLAAMWWLMGVIWGEWDSYMVFSPLVLLPAIFVSLFIAWLFRVTYLLGARK